MDVRLLRDQLWLQVKEIPGVITIGIGKEDGEIALTIFVDETVINKDALPTEYANLPVIQVPGGQAIAYGG